MPAKKKRSSATKKAPVTKKAPTKKKTPAKKKAPAKKKTAAKKKEPTELPKQAEISIGMIGHVDHGKSTLTQALTGKFPDTHSEEIRRGISIRLGYAETEFRECLECESPTKYTTSKKCPVCGKDTVLRRRVAFVDAPGHEVLMATMLSGASIMDGALLVVAANERVPMPQTREHLAAMDIIGMEDLIICQNKIELVSEKAAIKNYKDLKNFISTTIAKNSPIIPISAVHHTNIDILVQNIEEHLPTPKRDEKLAPQMLVARSFDVNKPGQSPTTMRGGVVGGSIIQGKFTVDDEIEIRPGIRKGTKWQVIHTKIVSLRSGFGELETAFPGGLIGMGTHLDPSLTKSDSLVGQIVGYPDELPPIWDSLQLDRHLMERVVGSETQTIVQNIELNENLMLSVGTAKTVGAVSNVRKKGIEVNLRLPVCAEKGTRVAISRQIDRRWRLIGWGVIQGGKEKRQN
ncbi:MAG: translation initiation factor IF-2 subunit gamma [Candidatus Heimdallarchaeota archaeon]|nr:MAG: translation initiation factor IF-2 subunit gamma [Candidatus Heimdallarchaeota archaeon]